MDFTAETSERDLALIAKTVSGDKEALKAIRSSLRERGSLPTVWDAFAGFGGIPIAAQKLGLRVVANDLNPVAAMLTRAVADIPARFAVSRRCIRESQNALPIPAHRTCGGCAVLRRVAGESGFEAIVG